MPTTKRQLKPVPFTDVHFHDAFWAPRIETNRKITLPHIYRMLEETGRIGAFDLNFDARRPLAYHPDLWRLGPGQVDRGGLLLAGHRPQPRTPSHGRLRGR